MENDFDFENIIDYGNEIMTEIQLQHFSIQELKPHPQNSAIYGEQEDQELLEMVCQSQWIKPLLVTPQKIIISGHRRWRVAKQLGIESVKAEVRGFETSYEELETLLLENAYRQKTPEQKVREAQVWKIVERERAKNRQQSGLKQNQSTVQKNFTEREKGQSRDKIAEKIGFGCGVSYEKASKVVDYADTLRNTGKTEKANEILQVLNQQSIHKAYRTIKLDKQLNGERKPPLKHCSVASPQNQSLSDQNQIILGDCLEVMTTISDNTFDMVFADPPFNLKKDYNSYNDSKTQTEYLEWCHTWLQEIVRVTKTTGSLFVHNLPRWLIYFAGFLNPISQFRHWIVWEAGRGPTGKTLRQDHYGILYYSKSEDYTFYPIRNPHGICKKCHAFLKDYGGKQYVKHPFGPIVSDIWTDIARIRNEGNRDDHPCQLPIELLERLILMSTDAGDLVFDPFLGTGSTAIAAKKLGRRYMGIELDSQYLSLAKNKVQMVQPCMKHECYVSLSGHTIKTMRDEDFGNLNATGKNLGGCDRSLPHSFL